MVRVKEASTSPESKKFNPADFPRDTNIIFFDDTTKKWELGLVDSWADPVEDRDGKLRGEINTSRGLRDLRLSQPPKKIDQIPSVGTVLNVNGKDYVIDLSEARVIQDTGDVEFALVNQSDPNDRLENINLKTVKNLETVQNFEQDVALKAREIRNKVQTKADTRGKEVLSELAELQKKVTEAEETLGNLSEWAEVDQRQASAIEAQIKRLQKEVDTALLDLEKKLDDIQPRAKGTDTLSEEAAGLQSRLERTAQRDSQGAKDEYKRLVKEAKDGYEAWKKEKAQWDKDKKAREKWDKDHKGDEPADPGTAPDEPTKPEDVEAVNMDKVKADSAFALFEELEKSASGKHKEIIDKVKERADKQAKREGFSGYDDAGYAEDKKQVIAEIFQAVLAEEKVKVAVPEEKLNPKAEKEELKIKIKAIVERAKAAGMGVPTGSGSWDDLQTNWFNVVDGISDDVPTDPTAKKNQEQDILRQWELLGIRELAVYKEERAKIVHPEKEEVEVDVDIPDTVLRELFNDRQKEVRAAMEAIYNQELLAGDERSDNEAVLKALKDLMRRSPHDALLKKLRQYGIKNWDQFKDVWDKKMAKKAVGVLHEWGQADLKSEMAKQIGAGDVISALKWQLGARIITNIALVGGGAALTTAIFASGGVAGIALAAAGGAAGGGVRAFLQKFVFGSKTLEDRKKKALEEMYSKKRTDIINNTLDKRFGGSGRTNMTAETNVIFSSIMAEAIRTASEEAVKGVREDFSSDESRTLKGDEKRLYIQALKNAREAGVELTQDQKIKMAVALQDLTRRGEQVRAQAVKETDPLIIKMLDGVMAGYSGQLANKENYGLAGSTATVAAGAAAGAAFFSSSAVARGILGGLGGAAAGYKIGEGLRSKAEVKDAESAFMPRFQKAAQYWEQYSNDPNYLLPEELKEFGDDIKNFNRYLKGEADTVAEQKLVALLQSNPQLRQQTENLVYQAYRRGVFARINLVEMQQHAQEASAVAEIKLADSTKAWLKKTTWRTGSVLAGAVAGATFSVLAGRGVQEVRNDISHLIHGDQGHVAPVIHSHHAAEAKGAATAVAGAAAIENNPSAGHTVYTGPEHAAPAPAPAPETPPVAVGHEAAPIQNPGLISAEGKAAGFVDWRHQIMEKMGYKFENGKILHALRFHPGAKMELVDNKGNVVEHFDFKKGDSTWRAMDHFHKQAGHMIKAGETPSVRIVDNGKVEVLDKYRVETHTLDKTHTGLVEEGAKEVAPVRNVGPSEFKQGYFSKDGDVHSTYYGRSGHPYNPLFGENEKTPFAFSDKDGHLFDSKTGEYIGTSGTAGPKVLREFSDAAHDLPKGNFDLSTVDAGKAGKFIGADGLEYQQVPGSKTGDYYLRNNHLYDFEGKYIGENSAAGGRHIVWSGGGNVENKNGLEAMLKGTQPGGAAEAQTPVGAKSEPTADTLSAKAPTDQVEIKPTVETGVPSNFVGHETQYQALQSMEHDVADSLSRDLGIGLSGDKAGVMTQLTHKIDTIFSDSPKLLDNSDIQNALTAGDKPASTRLAEVLQILQANDHIHLSNEEKILLGPNFTKGGDFVTLKNVDYNGESVSAIVAKSGSHAIAFENPKTGAIEVVTNSKLNFDPDHVSTRGFSASGTKVNVKTGGFHSEDTHISL